MLETPMAPPPAAAAESTSSSCLSRGGWPVSSSRPPAVDTATAVPMVSKKSLTKSTKITGTSAHVSASTRLAGFSASPMVEKSEPFGKRATASGQSRIPKIRPSAVETMIPIRIAPLKPRAVRTIITSRPASAISGGPAVRMPRPIPVASLLTVMPASRKPDERDEQADADADRELDLVRDGAHDRLAQAGEHEDQRDDALDDDARHRHRPRQLAAEDQVEGDDGVEAEARGERERQVRRQRP